MHGLYGDRFDRNNMAHFLLSIFLILFTLTAYGDQDSPPKIYGNPTTRINVGSFYSFVPSVRDNNKKTYTFTIINKPTWADFNNQTGALSGIPTVDDTGVTHSIVISVSDGKKGVARLPAFNLRVLQSNRDSVISGVPATSVSVGIAYNFTPIISESIKESVTFSIVNKPVWASFNKNTGALTGTPTAADVGITQNILISANLGNARVIMLPPFNLSIIFTNRKPNISGTPIGLIAVANPYNFIPVVSDVDNDPLAFSIINKPSWANFDPATGALTGTPTAADVGLIKGIVISVSDSKGGVAKMPAFNLTVIQSNRNPVISGVPLSSITLANAYSFIPVASDLDNDKLTFSIANKPVWANFNILTGALTGTPTAPDIGTTSDIVISVNDGKGGVASLSAFNLTVGKSNNTPTISGTPSTSIKVTSAYTFIPVASDIDQDPLIFSIVNKPAWADFSATTGALTGTPTTANVGTTPGIVISVSDGKGGTANLAAFNLSVDKSNAVPTVSGAPSTYVNIGFAYNFVPVASDTDKDVLTFSITNKPTWAAFDTATGALTGSPTAADNGTTTNNIVLSVTDGKSPTVSLPAFSIKVASPINLAKLFGAATQGQDWNSTYVASKVIDGNMTNFNHTTCDATKNWWQVRLPDSSQISQIKIYNRGDWAPNMINGAGLYVSNQPYNGNLNDSEKVDILSATTLPKAISFSTPKSGIYVIVKAANSNCLHLAEVEVYGQTNLPPKFDQTYYTFQQGWNSPVSTLVGAIKASSYQSDSVTYAIEGSVPFSINAQGSLSVSAPLQASSRYSFNVVANDGIFTSKAAVTVITTATNALATALQSGDASNITVNELLNAGIDQAQLESTTCKTELAKIYSGALPQSIFPFRSSYLNSTSPRNIPVHVAKENSNVLVYSWMGNKVNGSPYAVLGTNVFSFSTINTELEDNTLNVIRWLLNLSPATDVLNQPLVVLVPNSSDRTSLQTWFKANNLGHHWTIASDAALLDSGLYDLYLADIDYSLPNIPKVLQAKKPILVFNNWYQPNTEALAAFDLTWVWYGSQTIGQFSSIGEQCEKTSSSSQIQTLLTNLQIGMPDFIYEATDCPDSCDLSKVIDNAGNGANTLFEVGVKALRSKLNKLDNLGTNVFSLNDDNRLLKIAVLLGDKYREAIHYPMDKKTTDDTTFYRALYADYAVQYARPDNAPQTDMGDFTDAQAALYSTTGVNRTRAYTPTAYSEWTSTGLYAPPGKTITVARTDNSQTTVKIRFNLIRYTTKPWYENGYSRPLYMSSPEIVLKPGQTYTLSTPYGGPIYLGWQGVASGATPFTIQLNNVLDNPLLETFDDASISSFLHEVESTNSDWIDIKTPFAELHSLKSYLLRAFARQDKNEGNGYTFADVQTYVNELNTYLILNNYAFAGFVGTGIRPLNPEVSSFCNMLNLTNVLYDNAIRNLCTDPVIHAKPQIQHIGSDIHATCGYMCSGNPFDAGTSISPLGWGENHEMGHNLQRGRLMIYGGKSTEVSNNIFPRHTRREWLIDHGLTEEATPSYLYMQTAYDILQKAISTGVTASTNHPLWNGSPGAEPLAFYIQLMYSHQTWDVYTKMYIMERIFSNALQSDAKWNTVKNLLGFGNYTRTDAQNINGNDFMYIASSVIAGMNYSDYFEVWGIELTSTAKAQVLANNLTTQAPLRYYYTTNELRVALPTNADTIPLDGVSQWLKPAP